MSHSPQEQPPLISIVIPVYNEEKGLPELFSRTAAALEALNPDFEVVCVDDGSGDRSLELLVGRHREDPRFKAIALSRNFGHQRAVLAGLAYARGNFVGVMDADLQDPPELFADFLKRMEEGFDVVYAVRKKRKEGWLRRIAYWVFYRILTQIADLRMPVDSGDFCLMRRQVLDEILRMPEQSLFLRGLRFWVGFRQTGFEYERPERFAGNTKYSLKHLLRLAYNGIFSFSDFPIRFLGRLGYFTIMASAGYTLFILSKKLIWGEIIEGFTTLILAIFFFGGVQLASIRILGEYISRIYDQSRARPLFIVREAHL